MTHDILLAIWFLLPAAFANAIPVIAAAVPGLKKLNAPIDGGKTFRGQPLLGSHKTWRGIIAGIIIATLTLWVQQLLVGQFAWAQFIAGEVNYAALPLFLLGPLFAIGALGGDAVESFFKRQLKIKSGGSWVPFDQLDYIVGSVLVSLPFIVLTVPQYIWIFVVWFALHLLASAGGYVIGLKKDPI